MSTKIKAIELIDSYFVLLDGFVPFEQVKQCALISVDEILIIFYDDIQSMWLDELNYWHDVKNEINKL
jgi:hypothetical protein